MKKNKLTIVLLIALAIVAIFVIKKNKHSTLSGKDNDFAVKDPNTINKIFITNKLGGSATLTKKENGKWMINDKYDASNEDVQLLLSTFKNIQIKFPAPEAAQDHLLKAIASKGIKCEIYENSKLSKIWYVGHETQDLRGTYCLLQSGDNEKPFNTVYAVELPGFIGMLGPRFFLAEEDWREKKVLALTPDKIKNVTINLLGAPDSSYSIDVKGIRNFDVTTLSGKKINPLDTMAVKQYLSYFMNLYVEAWCTNSKLHDVDSVKKTNYFLELSITDVDNKKQSFKFYHKPPNVEQEKNLDDKGKLLPFDPDNMYVKLQDGKEFARVAVFQWGKIFEPSSYFYPKSVKK